MKIIKEDFEISKWAYMDWQEKKRKIDWSKVNDLCNYVFDETGDAKDYCNFKYKDNYLAASTLINGGYETNKPASRDEQDEKSIRKKCKERGISCRISVINHRDRFDYLEAIKATLKIPYDDIAKNLTEDLIIPNVVDAIDVVELTPEGPAQGLDTAIADLILNSIQTSTGKLQEYNILNANLGNHEDLREILTEVMADENAILGKLQTMLKVISPNAVEIMNGAVEAEEQLSESYDYDSDDNSDYDFDYSDKEIVTFTNFYELPNDCVETYEEGYVLYSPSTDKLYKYIGK